MKNSSQPRIILPFLLAVLVHVIIFAYVFFAFALPTKMNFSAPTASSKPPVNIVNAVTISQEQVEKEVAKLQRQAESKQAAHEAKQRELYNQQQALKQQEQRTAKAMAALKAQQTRVMAEQRSALKKLQQQKNSFHQQQAEQALQQQVAAEQKAQMAANTRRVSAIVSKYNGLILSAIRANFNITKNQQNMSMDVLISLSPGGTVLSVTVQKSSGSPIFDRAGIAAVYKSSPLPVPKDGQAFAPFKQFRLTLHPQDIVNS
jgi:colicin import membrane protein